MISGDNILRKRCSSCNKFLPATLEFFAKGNVTKYRLQSMCRSCRKAYDAPTSRERNLKRDYGISDKDYQEMFDAQQGLCAICRQPETRSNQYGLRKLNVDHCHVTGAVRGLLCANCNTVLGLLCEDPNITQALLKYIKERCLW